jgi:serine/threonine protein kinase
MVERSFHSMRVSHDLVGEVISSLTEHGYNLDDYLGTGSFGSVYLVKTVRYKETFVVKVLSRTSGHSYSPSSFAEEFEPLLKLHHVSLVHIHQIWSTDHFHYLLLDYMSHGPITKLVRERKGLDELTLRNFGTQILSALAFCHSKNICHGDIKPANILLDELSRARVADFGLPGAFARLNRESGTVRGSIAFLPPERLLGQAGDPRAADVWALGVTFFVLATNALPWRLTSVAAAIQQIKEAWVVFPESMPSTLCDVLSRMLSANPEDRPSFLEVLEMPFFRQSGEIPVVPTLINPMALPTSQTFFVPKLPAQPKPGGTRLAYPAQAKMAVKRQFGSTGGRAPTPLGPLKGPRVSSEV